MIDLNTAGLADEISTAQVATAVESNELNEIQLDAVAGGKAAERNYAALVDVGAYEPDLVSMNTASMATTAVSIHD